MIQVSSKECFGIRHQAVLYVVRAETHHEAKAVLQNVMRDGTDDARFIGRATEVMCEHGTR